MNSVYKHLKKKCLQQDGRIDLPAIKNYLRNNLINIRLSDLNIIMNALVKLIDDTNYPDRVKRSFKNSVIRNKESKIYRTIIKLCEKAKKGNRSAAKTISSSETIKMARTLSGESKKRLIAKIINTNEFLKR